MIGWCLAIDETCNRVQHPVHWNASCVEVCFVRSSDLTALDVVLALVLGNSVD